MGNYEIVSRDEKTPFSSAFSSNAAASESDFTRVKPEELDRVLGKDRYSVSRSIEGLTRNVALAGRAGSVFPDFGHRRRRLLCGTFRRQPFYESEQATEHQ